LNAAALRQKKKPQPYIQIKNRQSWWLYLAVFISHSNKPRFDHLFQAYINELIIQGKRAKKIDCYSC